MKKILALTLCLALALAALTGCGGAPSSSAPSSAAGGASSGKEKSPAGQEPALTSTELNLYTWEGMFPQDVLDDFTAETGVKVNYSSFDTDETMLAKLETANGGDYDVVIADDYIIEMAISENLVAKLNRDQIPNYKNINPAFQGQFFDPADEYTVPYGAGVQTIVYDPAQVEKEITGYADLWDASFAGSLGITSNFRVMNGMALKIMGESYNTEDVATIEAAGAKLKELAPNIRLIKDDNLQDDLISGEVSAAVMYTSQVTMACLANPDLKVVYPSEGVGFGVMAQFVPVNAPHADAAFAFIDYILRPDVAKRCFEALGYYCTNQAADELIEPEYQAFLTLPADLDASRMEMIGNISAEAMEAHTKAWTEFRTACGQ